MKEHISATLDRTLLDRARKRAREQRRSLSNVLELALEKLLVEDRAATEASVVTTRARFRGRFARGECYAER
jgi:hypothetical protein